MGLQELENLISSNNYSITEYELILSKNKNLAPKNRAKIQFI